MADAHAAHAHVRITVDESRIIAAAERHIEAIENRTVAATPPPDDTFAIAEALGYGHTHEWGIAWDHHRVARIYQCIDCGARQ